MRRVEHYTSSGIGRKAVLYQDIDFVSICQLSQTRLYIKVLVFLSFFFYCFMLQLITSVLELVVVYL